MTTPASAAEKAAPTTAKRKRGSDRSRSDARLGWYLAGPAFVIMLLVTLYLILQPLWDSLFSLRLTAPDETEFIWLRNCQVRLGEPASWQSPWVTVVTTEITLAVELVLGVTLAMVRHRAATQPRGIVRPAILVPYGIVTVVSAFA